MGMNRKWNMKVFELHDDNGEEQIPSSDPIDEIGVDTGTRSIVMTKAPFDFSEIKESSKTKIIDINELVADQEVNTAFYDTSQWNYIEGSNIKAYINADAQNAVLTLKTLIRTTFDIGSNSTRWVITFNQLTDSSLYRSFFYFDGCPDDIITRYGYGMDIPQVGNPHLERTTGANYSNTIPIEGTTADEQYFTGEYDMPVVLVRWDDTYTLLYDNRYLLTIPTEQVSENRIGFWTWSSSTTKIYDFNFYPIDDDSDATNIVIAGIEDNAPSFSFDDVTIHIAKMEEEIV